MKEEEEGRKERDLGELTIEELEQQEGILLPDREALSPIAPRVPFDPAHLAVPPLTDESPDGAATIESPPEMPEGRGVMPSHW